MLLETDRSYGNGFLSKVLLAYESAGNELPASARDLAVFALEQGLWHADVAQQLKLCTAAISTALHNETHVDAQGRKVRTMHVVREKDTQMLMWDDIRTASPGHMETSFTQRREKIKNGCIHLKKDVDSFNDMHPQDVPVQLEFNFKDDIAESEQSTDMPSADLRRPKPR